MNYIGKSYLQLTKEEKDYFIDLYYKNKNLTVKEIEKRLGLSSRCTNTIFKEYNIKSRRKNRYTLNEDYFKNIDRQEQVYILGLLYADGFIGDEKTNNISITQKNIEILQHIKEEIEFTGDIRKGNKGGFENSQEGYVLNFSSEIMDNDLRKLGLYSNKSLTIENIPNIKLDLKRHFLRGYFDGDGSISIYNHTFVKNNKLYSYTKGIMTIIATQKMIENFICEFNIEKYSITKSKTEEMKYIRMNSKKQLLEIYNIMYENASIYNRIKKIKWDEIISAII